MFQLQPIDLGQNYLLKRETSPNLVNRDATVIWHPYTQHKSMSEVLPVIKGEQSCLIDVQGNRYIDAISSWWTNIHGHAHPFIAQKIYEQALQLQHVIFAGCTHEPAVALAEQLLPLLPGQMARVFYSDNGSTAVEVALKMAIQFQQQQEIYPKKISRNKLIALKNAYHGDTFGAMSVSDRGVFSLAFQHYLFEVIFLDPNCPHQTLKEQCAQYNMNEVAAIIYEPLVQGAGGMNMYDASQLNDLVCYLKQENVVCIADEVMTGFGRTGQLFASTYIYHSPDIICLSKGITGGSLPLAVTACTQKIFDAFLSDDLYKTFFHGHSYTANPLACAAALASLELLQNDNCLDGIARIAEGHVKWVEKQRQNNKINDPRSLGTILAFELNNGKKDYLNQQKQRIIDIAMKEGVFLRPLGNTIYLMPPYCITMEEQEKLYDVLEKIIGDV